MKLISLLVPAALAAEPDVHVEASSGVVVGTIDLHASASDVRNLVQDPMKTAEVGYSMMDVTAAGTDAGGCELVNYSIPTVVRTIRYLGRTCPSSNGARLSLVTSEDLETYEATWAVEDLGEGKSRLVYRVLTKPNFPAPDFLVRGETTREVANTLTSVRDFIESKVPGL